jgi:tetratricopeptide (TPR) repeat protein
MMAEQNYPQYVQRMLAEARLLMAEDDFTAPDVAAICYEVLTLFPDCQEASGLILESFNDPWVIRENRKALGRLIDEWDDRSWQERRRLALSFRSMSRWEGQYREYDSAIDPEDILPSDVKDLLEEGRGQLLQDYLLGESKGGEVAWPIFQEAIKRTHRPRAAMLWVADLYADQGYFAESVDVLETLLAQFPLDNEARRYWVEVRWWRDHQEEIPWIPPRTGSDGRRYRHMMRQIDPEFAADEETYLHPLPYRPPNSDNLPDDFVLPEPVQAELVAHVEDVLRDLKMEPGGVTAVDWSYLDKLESGDVDLADFPEWMQYLLLEIDDPAQQAFLKQLLLQQLSNPPHKDENDGPDDEAF